jgi:hypothetical protein
LVLCTTSVLCDWKYHIIERVAFSSLIQLSDKGFAVILGIFTKLDMLTDQQGEASGPLVRKPCFLSRLFLQLRVIASFQYKTNFAKRTFPQNFISPFNTLKSFFTTSSRKTFMS